jgi:hypothetical protein
VEIITEAIAIKVRDTVDAGLVSGVGQPIPGQMCVEAAVCYALGLPHGDDPPCVSRALRSLKIGLNDAQWSGAQSRAKGMRRLALAQLGSRDALDDRELMRRVTEMTIRVSVPSALRCAAKLNPKHSDALEAAAVRCEREGTPNSARAAAAAADAAYAAANAADAVYAAADAVYAAAYAADAVYAAYAYAAAAAYAYAASNAVYAAADAVYAADAARDASLSDYAERVVQILIDMNAPGCQWLSLVPKEESQ